MKVPLGSELVTTRGRARLNGVKLSTTVLVGASRLEWALGEEPWHERDWENMPGYWQLARRIRNLLGPGPPSPYLVQREPNLRVHPPGGKSVPWHTDAEFGHQAEEVNVWVPLMECTDDSQRLWIKDETGTHPVDVPLGDAFVFNGARVRHGVIRNRTPVTRYSFDFRLLRRSDCRDEGRVSVLYGVPLRLGDYWRELT